MKAYSGMPFRVERAGETIQTKHNAIADGKKAAKQLQEELKRIEKEVEDISRRRDKEMQKGGKVQTLDNKLKDLAKELAKTRTQLDLKKQTIEEDEKRVSEAEAAVKEVSCERSELVISFILTSPLSSACSTEGREESFTCSSYREAVSDQRQL